MKWEKYYGPIECRPVFLVGIFDLFPWLIHVNLEFYSSCCDRELLSFFMNSSSAYFLHSWQGFRVDFVNVSLQIFLCYWCSHKFFSVPQYIYFFSTFLDLSIERKLTSVLHLFLLFRLLTSIWMHREFLHLPFLAFFLLQSGNQLWKMKLTEDSVRFTYWVPKILVLSRFVSKKKTKK